MAASVGNVIRPGDAPRSGEPRPARQPGIAGSAQGFISSAPDVEALTALAHGRSLLSIDGLVAGYGPMEILHGISLRVAAGQSLCLVGPNGAGKSTVLHSIYGFTDIRSGTVTVADKDVIGLSSSQKLAHARIAYVLQDSAVFPDMSVEENLIMGGFLMKRPAKARQAAERILQKYDRLARRRNHPARVLSGGERRLLEIVRALIMDPAILLVDEPSIGLEPRSIEMVFEILSELQRNEGKTIVMVEQNARKGLAFADIGYVLVSGRVARAGRGPELLDDPEIGRLFLGG